MRDPAPTPIRTRRVAFLRPGLRLVLGLMLLIVVGTLALMLPGVAVRPLSFGDAAFTAASALSVTGLSVITPVKDLTPLGQAFLLLLIQIGGVGYMVIAVMAFRLLGRQVGLEERLALRDSLGLLSPRGILGLAGQILRTVLAIELVGAIALWLHWRQSMPEGRAIYYGVFHSISAFSNAGFDLFSGHPEHLEGVPRDNLTLVLLATIIFIGGLGIPVIFDLIAWHKRREFSLHTKITVPLTLTLVVIGGVAIYLSEAMMGGTLATSPTLDAMVMSTFQSVSSRTAGFSGLPNLAEISPATQLVMTSLMFIGGSPASMGGGTTTGTLAVLVLALVAYARGRETPVFRGRAIPGEMVRKGAAILTLSLLLVVGATWLIALTHRQSLAVVLFEVVSAFSTCGLTLDFTSQLNPFGRTVIVLVMFCGRLGALTIFVTIAGAGHPHIARYPEEKILIG
ncbi:MAG: TrkH family potassium uptake protein [Fimbriimonas sp.]